MDLRATRVSRARHRTAGQRATGVQPRLTGAGGCGIQNAAQTSVPGARLTNKNNFWTDADAGILLLRITLGGLIFLHGFHKITHGIENQMQLLANKGIPEQLMYFVYVSEVLAPVLLVLGVFTRLSALSIVITLITILYAAPFPILGLDEHGALNGGLQFLYLLCLAALFFMGAGRYRLWNSGTTHCFMD